MALEETRLGGKKTGAFGLSAKELCPLNGGGAMLGANPIGGFKAVFGSYGL